jgi:PBP1b-binding outer membrane lipoprotein LpoB
VKKLFSLLMAILFLSGCGGATYFYQHGQDIIYVKSDRTIEHIDFSYDPVTSKMTVSTGKVKSALNAEDLSLFTNAIVEAVAKVYLP